MERAARADPDLGGHPVDPRRSAGDLFTGLTPVFIGTAFTLLGGFVGFVLARSGP